MNIKHSLYGLLCGTLMLASCSNDEPTAPGAQTVEASFSLNIAGEVATRAGNGNSSLGGADAENLGAENLNYILALYEVADNNALILSDFCQVSDRDGDGERFSPMVTLGKTYMMVALAHFGDKRNIADADNYLKAMPIENIINSEAEDFYVATKTARFTVDNLQHALTLKRPYAKLRIVATDWNQSAIESVTVDYAANTLFSQFNVLTNQFSIDSRTKRISASQYNTSDVATAKTIVADYFPVNTVSPTTYLSAFTVTVTLNDDSHSRFSRTFSDIPLRRNALTTLSGAFFSSQSQMKCDVTND